MTTWLAEDARSVPWNIIAEIRTLDLDHGDLALPDAGTSLEATHGSNDSGQGDTRRDVPAEGGS